MRSSMCAQTMTRTLNRLCGLIYSIYIHYSDLAGGLQLDVLERTDALIMVPRVRLHQNQSRLHVSK